jgi:hypothetical protein
MTNETQTIQFDSVNPEAEVAVIVPYLSVNAVRTSHGRIAVLAEDYKELSRAEKRKLAKDMKRTKRALLKVDASLLKIQNENSDGEIIHHDLQIQFNNDALLVTVHEALSEGKDLNLNMALSFENVAGLVH